MITADDARADEPGQTVGAGLDPRLALARIAGRAADFDGDPRFPAANFDDLRAGGLLGRTSGYADEVRLVRAVAAADGSTARILDGHLNGVERLTLTAPAQLADDVAQVQDGRRLVGVWGADPGAGEGTPAHLATVHGRPVLRGVKTYCSGAGGVTRALIVAGGDNGEKSLVYIDSTTPALKIDRSWYRTSGLRASESHRVEFCDVPVLAVLGEPGELSRQPYFARDAIRTSATWAGLVDTIMAETVSLMRGRAKDPGDLQLLGQARIAASTIERWLSHTVSELEDVDAADNPAAVSTALECRLAISSCARSVMALSAEICGSRALTGATTLDRARRDLDLFLLQHRLNSKLRVLGEELVDDGGS